MGQWSGDPGTLSDDQRETVHAVMKFYGNRSAQGLSDLTHREDPWLNARHGLGDGERGNHEITLASLEEYYSSLS